MSFIKITSQTHFKFYLYYIYIFRLACHMSNYFCFQIELTRGYDYSAFRNDLKRLYQHAGIKRENTVFLFTDTQVKIIFQKIFYIST